MESYDTLSEALNALRAQGYTEDFNLKQNSLECLKSGHEVTPEDFKIDKSFRFDVNEDPSDQAMLYAISSAKHGLKGVLVGGYGIYSDALSNEMLEKLK
jgi:EAL domain-containing protein (putative c-di-GMP-specific phosphodiesterase class I)